MLTIKSQTELVEFLNNTKPNPVSVILEIDKELHKRGKKYTYLIIPYTDNYTDYRSAELFKPEELPWPIAHCGE